MDRFTTGHQLKLARVDARLTGRALARAMGVTPQRVSAIEASERPTPAAVVRFRTALAVLSGSGDQTAES